MYVAWCVGFGLYDLSVLRVGRTLSLSHGGGVIPYDGAQNDNKSAESHDGPGEYFGEEFGDRDVLEVFEGEIEFHGIAPRMKEKWIVKVSQGLHTRHLVKGL